MYVIISGAIMKINNSKNIVKNQQRNENGTQKNIC